MAPSVVVESSSAELPAVQPVKKASSESLLREPLTYSGSLSSYEQFDETPVFDREFPALQLSEILQEDAKIRDLGILGLGLAVDENGKLDHEISVISADLARKFHRDRVSLAAKNLASNG